MAGNLYALLVGIDKYPGKPLNGCVNDIHAVEKYLTTRLKYQPVEKLLDKEDTGKAIIKCLLDEQAKRGAIIEAFEQHLCHPEKDDVVLFYYCGHGSQEVAGEEFYEWEPDKKLETIVCYDSRQTLKDGTEVRDLADKEIRYLIAKVARSEPHILVIYDCCHSGSGTRGEAEEGVRSASIDVRPPRKYEDFLFAKEVTRDDLRVRKFPEGKHVFIAACLSSETAKETKADGNQRGIFSYYLIKELESLNSALSYESLLRQVKFRVNVRRRDQTPQVEPIGLQRKELSKLAFLGDSTTIKPSEPLILSYRPPIPDKGQKEEWIVNAGATLLLGGSELSVHEYREYRTSGEMQEPSNQLGQVKVTQVRLDESVVEFITNPKPSGETFYAALTKQLLPRTTFYLEGETEILLQVEKQLEKSLYARVERNRDKEHDYRLYAREQHFEIRNTEDRLLVLPIEGYRINEAVSQVNHIARWAQIRAMENPSKLLPDNAVEVEIYHNDNLMTGSDLRLEYRYNNGEWQPPIIKLKLKNTQNRPFYCALLYLEDDYSVSIPGVLPEGGDYSWICLDKNCLEYQAQVFQDGIPVSEEIRIFISDEVLETGVIEFNSVIKLIVSTSQFDVSSYVQGSLLLPSSERPMGGSVTSEGWMTKSITLTIVGPQKDIKLTPQKNLLASGVIITAPNGLNASARLTSTTSGERGINSIALPFLLKNTGIFQFATSRSIAQDLSVLEMEVDSSTIDTVTPNSPITISVEEALKPDERILAVAYDGEFYYPLGLGQQKNEKIEIKIERLYSPQSIDSTERKFSQAIQMCFRKILLTQSGQESSYAWLRKAQIKSDGTVGFTERDDLESVRTAIANAKKIILYIHGIIGDTESMIPSTRYAKLNVNGQARALEEEYELVLAFDYESLNTSIEDIAKELKKQLTAVGLKPEHGKTLHIVAHSMGGLVSRYFIEQLGGGQVVSHLIMVGTPNGGSPWSTVHDLATTLLFFGLNLSSVPIVPSLLEKLIGAMSVTLKEMHSTKASFLEQLNAEYASHCPYSIIAGSTALMDQQADMEKLLIALKTKLRKMAEFPFGDNENDIAVAVKDIIGIFNNQLPSERIQHIPCDHLSYFRRETGLKALSDAVSRACGYS